MSQSLQLLRMAITPYYLSLIDPDNPECPIRKQAIPTKSEMYRSPADLLDPLHEDEDSPVPGLTHRYPDRVLLLITDQCSMYCRHCTRRRFAGQKDHEASGDRIQKAIDYIAATPQVRDVLLSGGDPLTMNDNKLESIIKRLRSIPHVEIIRLARAFRLSARKGLHRTYADVEKYQPIWINTHFNHPNEITPTSSAACEMMADAGFPLGNQSVLLRGINDCVHTMKDLVRKLVMIRYARIIFINAIYPWDWNISERLFPKELKSLRACADIHRDMQYLLLWWMRRWWRKIPVMPTYVISQARPHGIA